MRLKTWSVLVAVGVLWLVVRVVHEHMAAPSEAAAMVRSNLESIAEAADEARREHHPLRGKEVQRLVNGMTWPSGRCRFDVMVAFGRQGADFETWNVMAQPADFEPFAGVSGIDGAPENWPAWLVASGDPRVQQTAEAVNAGW